MGIVFLLRFYKTFYFISFISLTFTIRFGSPVEIATKEECSTITPEGRTVCMDAFFRSFNSEKDCRSAGCCWDDNKDARIQCHNFTSCSPGFYGWRCHLRCRCLGIGTCNRSTGECDIPCVQGVWGVGCLLDNNCTYNDPSSLHYTGSRQHTDDNITCHSWERHKSYDLAQFPDKSAVSISSISNFCRNPITNVGVPSKTAWCFVSSSPHQFNRFWGLCTLASCTCPIGRFGPSCVYECHCNDPYETCDPLRGKCSGSGCHARWSGDECSECADGYFGQSCQYDCKCNSPSEVCDKLTGFCESGCSPGWQGPACHEECDDGYFGLNCEFTCNCRQPEEVCLKMAGACNSGCRHGFGGDGCQTQLPQLSRAPTANKRNASSITIEWKEWNQSRDKGSGPVVRYQVFFRPAGRQDWTFAPNEINNKLITVTNLNSESKYEFQVTPVHASDFLGLPSPILEASTCGKPLSGVQSLSAKISSANRKDDINLEWKSPKRDQWNCMSIAGFNVSYSNSSNGSSSSFEFYHFARVHRVQLTNVDPYQNLTIAIAVVNNAQLEGPPSFYNYIGKSGPVVDLEAQAKSTSVILLTWSPPSHSNGKIEGYSYSYKPIRSGGCTDRSLNSRQEHWTPLIDINSSQNQLEISDLNVYSFYTFKIWPKTRAGRGQEAVVIGNTSPSEPYANLTLNLVSINSKSAVVSWRSVDCLKWNGEVVGYMYELHAHAHLEDTSPVLEASESKNDSNVSNWLYDLGLVNQSRLALDQLIPFLNYTLYVWLANHMYNGSKSVLTLETHEDAPPQPKNVRVDNKTSESLFVKWNKPEPPQGLITQYSVRYFIIRNSHSELKEVNIEGARTLSCNITKLTPYEHYGLQVRASTKIGDGPWSELVEEYTEESSPSQPLDLTNSSRNSSSVELRWMMPEHSNGIIKFYHVACAPVHHFGPMKDVPAPKVVYPPNLNFTVGNLNPGTNYVCRVAANTQKGQGTSASILLWTEPEISFQLSPPVLQQAQHVDNLIIVQLQPAGSIGYMEDPDSLYRVVVETLDDEKMFNSKRTKRHKSSLPCNLDPSELLSYSLAMLRGLKCYVAAEIPRLAQPRQFVVGDNKTYGGYYNARLNPDIEHDVWLGLVVTVDGVTISSYSKTDQPERALGKNRLMKASAVPKGSSGNISSVNPVTGAVIGSMAAVIFIALLITLFAYKFLRNRKLKMKPSSSIVFDSTTDTISEQHTRLLPVEPSENSSKMYNLIPVSQLWNHVVPRRQADHDNLRTEFGELRKENLFNVDVAKKTENKAKNRYHNIFPYDHSRIILDCLPNEPHSDYINANYIDGYKRPAAFVAAQGPVESTVEDTWRMMWQLNSRVIIMVTNLEEGGRQKCKQYWPDSGSQQYGEVTVELQDVEEYADYIIRTFVISKNVEKRMVKQFHFTTWPDHGIPEHPTSLLEFRKKVRSYADDELKKDPDSGPCMVHCSAGVGRTGCYIALDYSLDMAEEEGYVDVFNFVKRMRDDRVNMIQTVEQYIFVYEALLEALQAGVTSIPCSEFRSSYARLNGINPMTENSYLLEEFEMLESTNLLYNQDDRRTDAILPENAKKNKSNKALTNSHGQPHLNMLNGKASNLNTVFVDGYKHSNAFIVTRSPSSDTALDFWATVAEYKCGAIISLDDPNAKEEDESSYFPTSSSESIEISPFQIKLLFSDYSPYFSQQDFLLSSSPKKDSRNKKDMVIKYFKIKSWTTSYDKINASEKANLPSRSSVLALLGALEKWQQYNGNSTVLVYCRDGATHSGIFCASSFLVEKLKIEHEVDVFFSIRHIRVNRPQFIPNLIQYQYLYDLAIDYLDCFDTYANFESSI